MPIADLRVGMRIRWVHGRHGRGAVMEVIAIRATHVDLRVIRPDHTHTSHTRAALQRVLLHAEEVV